MVTVLLLLAVLMLQVMAEDGPALSDAEQRGSRTLLAGELPLPLGVSA